MDWTGLGKPKWTKKTGTDQMDRSGPKCYANVIQQKCRNNKFFALAF